MPVDQFYADALSRIGMDVSISVVVKAVLEDEGYKISSVQITSSHSAVIAISIKDSFHIFDIFWLYGPDDAENNIEAMIMHIIKEVGIKYQEKLNEINMHEALE